MRMRGNNFIKGGFSVEVVGSDGKKLNWKVVRNHIGVKDKDNGQIGLRVFYFSLYYIFQGGT